MIGSVTTFDVTAEDICSICKIKPAYRKERYCHWNPQTQTSTDIETILLCVLCGINHSEKKLYDSNESKWSNGVQCLCASNTCLEFYEAKQRGETPVLKVWTQEEIDEEDRKHQEWVESGKPMLRYTMKPVSVILNDDWIVLKDSE